MHKISKQAQAILDAVDGEQNNASDLLRAYVDRNGGSYIELFEKKDPHYMFCLDRLIEANAMHDAAHRAVGR